MLRQGSILIHSLKSIKLTKVRRPVFGMNGGKEWWKMGGELLLVDVEKERKREGGVEAVCLREGERRVFSSKQGQLTKAGKDSKWMCSFGFRPPTYNIRPFYMQRCACMSAPV